MHPVVAVFGDEVPGLDGRPGWVAPYFERHGLTFDDPSDYADPAAQLGNARTIQFMHPLAKSSAACCKPGCSSTGCTNMTALTWQQFRCLVRDADGCWTWPDRPWLPLSLSLSARKT